MDTILSKRSVSVTDLKRDYASILRASADAPVAVLNQNRLEAYLVSAVYFESLLDRLENLEDALLVHQRADGPFIEVKRDDL